ncbi:hypothetical protein NP493_5259g00001, partial [Ridgeia piscesae]
WLNKLQNTTYAEYIRRKVKDDGVSPLQFYLPDQDDNTTRQDTGGTSHLSVLALDGAAVFGCKIIGNRTGIVFNNMMDLFTLPAKGNISANHIAPGKRGRSSVSPIMVRDRDGQVALLAGGAGSKRIITATSFDILDGLKRKGHTKFTLTHVKYPYLAVVEAIDAKTCLKCRPTDSFTSCIHAASDYRKSGVPDGY